MTPRARLDAELVRRGLAATRSEAKRVIDEGLVLIPGLPTPTPASLISPDDNIKIDGGAARFVSRGGDKLDRALARLDVQVKDRTWLDAGASTGGFTDRLLQGGASGVIAIDVGYGQLHWRLRNDERVVVLERTNVRALAPEDLPYLPQAVTGDLSFISLRLVLPSLVSLAEPHAAFVLLVKPQFEVGKGAVGRGGVVRDPELWASAINSVIEEADTLGLGFARAVPSELPGPAGNREFFVHLERGADGDLGSVDRAVAEAAS